MDNHSIEEGFTKLENILEQLESNNISLEDSFDLYKKGMLEIDYCNKKLETTKKSVMSLQQDGTLGVFEEDE